MSKKIQGITKAIKGLKTAVGSKKTRARNKKSTADLRNKETKDAFKKANSSRAELRNKATKDAFEKANSQKTQSLKKDVKGLTKSLKEASKSPLGKESKLEKSVKKIEDMKKDPKFIRLRKRANEIRKKKGLPTKPEFSKGGMVTKWESKWG